MPTVAPRLLLLAPAIVPALVVAIVVAAVLDPPLSLLIGLVVGVAIAVALIWWFERRAPEAALRSLGAQPLIPGSEPRLESLVESICASHGISEPQLYLVESRAPDAAVAGNANDTRLVVTTGALRQLDRLELQAVVARELVMFGNGIHAATVLASVAPFYGPFADRLRSRLLDDRRLAMVDIEGVRLTRYPPALAGAFEKAANADGVPDKAASRHLWLIGPRGSHGVVQPLLTERIDTLREL
ncbi:MAG: M48 family metalloprotease [Acidimicrobiales bacterium]|nr:M48 family metalloprotease [Acidimicrobiales bacterium]